MRLREVKADWRGYTPELLAKAPRRIASTSLSAKEDGQRIVDWLRFDGGLNDKMACAVGTTRLSRLSGRVKVAGIPTDA